MQTRIISALLFVVAVVSCGKKKNDDAEATNPFSPQQQGFIAADGLLMLTEVLFSQDELGTTTKWPERQAFAMFGCAPTATCQIEGNAAVITKTFLCDKNVQVNTTTVALKSRGTVVRRYERRNGNAIGCTGDKPEVDLGQFDLLDPGEFVIKDTVDRKIERVQTVTEPSGGTHEINKVSDVTGEIETSFLHLDKNFRHKEVSGKLKRVLTANDESFDLDVALNKVRVWNEFHKTAIDHKVTFGSVTLTLAGKGSVTVSPYDNLNWYPAYLKAEPGAQQTICVLPNGLLMAEVRTANNTVVSKPYHYFHERRNSDDVCADSAKEEQQGTMLRPGEARVKPPFNEYFDVTGEL